MKRILVVGASSFIGFHVVSELKNHDIYLTYKTHNIFRGKNSIKLDVMNKEQASKIFSKIKPEIVVLLAAVSSAGYPSLKDYKTNTEGAKNIIEHCRKYNSKLIFMSSDQVFSGKKGFYSEKNIPRPATAYGKSKLFGEKMIKKRIKDYAIIRTSMVCGWNKKKTHDNFVTLMLKRFRKNEKFVAYDNMYRTPTYVKDIGRLIKRIVDRDMEGVFHVGPGKLVNMYDFAKNVMRIFNLKGRLVKGHCKDKKPRKLGLNSRSTEKRVGTTFYSIEKGLKEMARGN